MHNFHYLPPDWCQENMNSWSLNQPYWRKTEFQWSTLSTHPSCALLYIPLCCVPIVFTMLVAITMISDRPIGLVDIGQQGWWRQVHQVPSPPPLSMGLLSVASVQTDMYLSRRAYSSCLMEFIEVLSVSGVLYWCTVSVWCAVLMYSPYNQLGRTGHSAFW